jgi:hypothetical protein
LVTVNPRRTEQVRRVIEAKHGVDKLIAKVKTLDQRKTMLEQIIALYLSDYFAEPHVPERIREKVEKLDRDHAFRQRNPTFHQKKEE